MVKAFETKSLFVLNQSMLGSYMVSA